MQGTNQIQSTKYTFCKSSLEILTTLNNTRQHATKYWTWLEARIFFLRQYILKHRKIPGGSTTFPSFL